MNGEPLRLIDIHSHLHFPPFAYDRDKVFARMQEANIGTILVGTSMETSRNAIAVAGQYPNTWASVGMHPTHFHSNFHDANELFDEEHFSKQKFDADEMLTLARHEKVVAIGECGLDYFRSAEDENIKRLQQEGFRAQIAIAREVGKPLVIHCRDAYESVLAILREEQAQKIGGHVHFFVGSWEIAQEFLELGFSLSFTGVITFASQYDEVIKNIPLDRIMVETDAPYVAPASFRGKRNESIYVEEVARRIAELKGISLEEVARATTENAQKLFRL